MLDLPRDPDEIDKLLRHMTAAEQKEFLRLVGGLPPTFAQFVEQTLNIKLDPWQVHLCNRLEKLAWQKDQRILVHAPPQHGKSVLLQRLIAYLVGVWPTIRIVYGCFNVSRSCDHSKAAMKVLKSDVYRDIFPAGGTRLVTPAPMDKWMTRAREEIADSQPSLAACGVDSGFVGRGMDLLILDDPYPSIEQAFSVAINNSLKNFWTGDVSSRLLPGANALIVFHRYHTNDIAGMLLEQGGWEFIRYPAIGDEDEEYPDAMGRVAGEPLSPRIEPGYYEQKQAESIINWYGLFQGLPRPSSGGYFKAEWFQETEDWSPFLDELPRPREVARQAWEPEPDMTPGSQYTTWVRAWDIAAGAKKRNDFNSGALMTVAQDGTLILADIQHFKSEWAETRERIIEQAALDHEYFGTSVYTIVEKKGIGEVAARDLASHQQFLRSPFKAVDPPHAEEKMLRANPWQAKLANRQFRMVRGPWVHGFISECMAFHGLPGGRDDRIDSVSLATQFLAQSGGGELTYEQPIKPDTHEYFRRLSELNRARNRDTSRRRRAA